MIQSDVIGIRRAESLDLNQLPDLIRNQDTLDGTTALAFDERGWASLLAAEGVFTYVAERQTIFGFVTAGPAWLDDPAIGEILGLYLHPTQRGEGLGRKLLVRGLSVLKLRDFETAIMFVNDDAPTAVRLLDSLGFFKSQYQREINAESSTSRQTGYLIDLEGYF